MPKPVRPAGAEPCEGRGREGIEPDPGAPRYLVTVRGLGYKFEP